MESESKKFTAFSTLQGEYIWNVLPVGLVNALQIFQRKMDNLFKDYFELQDHIVEKIRNFSDVLKDKKQLQSFLRVVNFTGIFTKDLTRYRKDFRPLLKEIECSKWKWKEIHTKRVRELKQFCSNMPKLAIPQDEDELVAYTDANDYRWATVLMKKTTTGEEPCRYTGGLKHLRENLEELDRKFGQLAVNAQVAGQIQRADLDTVQVAIRSSLLASTSLWNDLREPIWKASPSGMSHELKEHDPKYALRIQGSRPIASDSSTDYTRPSPDSGETTKIDSQEVQTHVDSSQSSTSRVKEGEISLRPMTGTSKVNTNELISSSAWQEYQRLDVRRVKTGRCSEMRPDMVAFNKIKAASGEASLISAITEASILWVCLTEMDKVKYPSKIFSNKVNGSFLLNSMIGKSIEFAECFLEKKRMLIWENKLPATEVTKMKTCNMLHVGQ
ncbi:UNVERIFIED_CONTAM: hypothetical protein Sindi_2491400 [Sesamum indicum]